MVTSILANNLRSGSVDWRKLMSGLLHLCCRKLELLFQATPSLFPPPPKVPVHVAQSCHKGQLLVWIPLPSLGATGILCIAHAEHASSFLRS